jgi:hypothetical protein
MCVEQGNGIKDLQLLSLCLEKPIRTYINCYYETAMQLMCWPNYSESTASQHAINIALKTTIIFHSGSDPMFMIGSPKFRTNPYYRSNAVRLQNDLLTVCNAY